MENDDRNGLRGELEALSTAELETRLYGELEKDSVDGKLVREIMRILRHRDAEDPKAIPSGVETVWEEMQDEPEAADPKPKRACMLRRLGNFAAVAAVLAVVIFGIPSAFGADNIVELVAGWTDGTFQFVTPGETVAQPSEYVFRTDHAGLREVYNTVSNRGVTVPVVPMWMPDGVELTELKVMEDPTITTVYAKLESKDMRTVLQLYIDKTGSIPRPQSLKDEEVVEKKEIGDVVHYIMDNTGDLVATWVNGHVEGVISTDVDKEILIDILRSMYIRKDGTT